MSNIIEITDLAAPELDVYLRLTEAQLKNRLHPEDGLFIAESPKVIGYALDAGYEPVSFLMERRHIAGKAAALLARAEGVPVYTADADVLRRLTGYPLTRGVLCAMRRRPLPSVEAICRDACRVAVLEGIVDTTNIGAIFRSAAALGVDPAGVEYAVLSHGHYDHADGLRAFFAANGKTPVLVRRGALGGYYSMRGGTAPRFVGIHRDIVRDYGSRLVEVDGLYELFPGGWLVENPAPEASEDRAQHLYKKLGEDRFAEDDFSHEHSLVLEGERGLVVFNSCCHAGAANIAAHIAKTFPGKPIAALFGGFHMMGATGTDSINCSPEYVRSVADQFKRLDIGCIYTGHCTGMPAFELLQTELGERLRYMKTGDRITL